MTDTVILQDTAPIIVWFRRDFRLADNPALTEAAKTGHPILPVYIHDPNAPAQCREGAASRWWLHHGLQALGLALQEQGIRLRLLSGEPRSVLIELARSVGAHSVLWNRRTEPWAIRADRTIAADLTALGVAARAFNGGLLFKPGSIVNQSGAPFKVFTPFWRACLKAPSPSLPLPSPNRLRPWDGAIAEDRLEDWTLAPVKPDWAHGFRECWTPGEGGAQRRLGDFLSRSLSSYAQGRDRPGRDGTSGLSPHLHFGEISPRQIFHAAHRRGQPDTGCDRFLAELGWREFSLQLIDRHPDLTENPLRPEFADFPWRDDPERLNAWRKGQTGYPIVDAGMRQLWRTGWMHNRVRMIVASFLIKDLLVSWRQGQDWFLDTLVDADLGVNAASWQWVAGCGADAAPFFRVFNPVLQGQKFDPDGAYVRRWCPELSRLPDQWLHQPWKAPAAVLAEAGIALGASYPGPIVDHDFARKRALEAFASIK